MTIAQLFPADLREDEATRLRRDLETYRAYLAGPCLPECPNAPDGGREDECHHEYTAWYEEHRTVIVNLNRILAGDFDRDFYAEQLPTLDGEL